MNMSEVMLKSLFICLGVFLALPVVADDTELALLYGLPEEIVREWQAIGEAGTNDPTAGLKIAQDKKQSIPKSELLQKYFAAIVIINLKLKLEHAPEALKDIETYEPVFENLPQTIYYARLLSAKARSLNNFGQYDEALVAANKAMKIFETLNSEKYRADIHQTKGHILNDKGLQKQALEEYLISYEIFEKSGDKKRLGSILSSIAIIYDQSGEQDKAIGYYKESIEYIDKDKQKFDLSVVYYNIGAAYYRKDDNKMAKSYLNDALQLSIQLKDDVGIAYAKTRLGLIEQKESNFKRSNAYFNSIIKILEKSNDKRMQMNVRVALAKNYSSLNRYELAKKNLRKAIEIANLLDNVDNYLSIYKAATTISEEQQEYREALDFQKKYTETLQKKHKMEQDEKLNGLMVKFDTEKKEAENILLQKENSLQTLSMEQQATKHKLMLIVLGFSIILVLGVIYGMLKQIKLRKRFASLAMTDELTKAPNRRHILEFTKTQFKVAKDTNTPLVIAMLDLDHFKAVNDTYGHDIGDLVLIAFYQTVQQSLRSVDRVGRLGGEEWLMVMPGVSIDQISSIFHRIRNSLKELSIKGLDPKHKITFSMGVAQISDQKETINAFIKRSDDAVYRAKEEGRDRWLA